jgi:hypothetical protein
MHPDIPWISFVQGVVLIWLSFIILHWLIVGDKVLATFIASTMIVVLALMLAGIILMHTH